VPTSNSRGSSLVPPIASIALTTRFRTTCCSCTETPFFATSPRVGAMTSSTASSNDEITQATPTTRKRDVADAA